MHVRKDCMGWQWGQWGPLQRLQQIIFSSWADIPYIDVGATRPFQGAHMMGHTALPVLKRCCAVAFLLFKDGVQLQEHKVYVEALQALCSGRVRWREDGMPIVDS